MESSGTYKIEIEFEDKTSAEFYATKSEIQLHHTNVVDYAHSLVEDPNQILNIIVYNNNVKHICYNKTIDKWRVTGQRIEVVNETGHEDYTGYGARTSGTKNRFYIGRSTGIIPTYVELLTKNSNGGKAMSLYHRKYHPLNEYKH
jgi:hypothetical protein